METQTSATAEVRKILCQWKRQYYIVMIRPQNVDATEEEQLHKDASDDWWCSCSSSVKKEDVIFTCRTGIGIEDEWDVIAERPKPSFEWNYTTCVDPVRTIEPPITIAELKRAFPYVEGDLDDLSTIDRFGRLVHTNFRGQKSGCWRIPYECVEIILQLRKLKPR